MGDVWRNGYMFNLTLDDLVKKWLDKSSVVTENSGESRDKRKSLHAWCRGYFDTYWDFSLQKSHVDIITNRFIPNTYWFNVKFMFEGCLGLIEEKFWRVRLWLSSTDHGSSIMIHDTKSWISSWITRPRSRVDKYARNRWIELSYELA